MQPGFFPRLSLPGFFGALIFEQIVKNQVLEYGSRTKFRRICDRFYGVLKMYSVFPLLHTDDITQRNHQGAKTRFSSPG
jgi:hypothetical protein